MMDDRRIEHDTGVARHFGRHVDAVEVAGPLRWLATSGTPGLDETGRLAGGFDELAELS